MGIGSGKQYEKEKTIVDNKELLDPSAFQRAELALKLKPMLSEKAKEGQGKRNDLAPNFPLKSAESKEVAEQLGELAGVSGKTIDRAAVIS